MTPMECWSLVAPILAPIDNRTIGIECYVMIFNALKEMQERMVKEQKK